MDDPQRVLCVTAHPDDIDFGAAGTVATWTASGIDVAYCIVTDGDAGGFDPAVPRDRIGGIRQAEQRAAAAAVGVLDVHFLGYRDGALEVTLDLRRDISRVIRQVRPDRVLSQSPHRSWRSVYRSHPDHRAAGDATLDAVYPDARNPFAHTTLLADEGLEAWTVPEVWVMADDGDEHTELRAVDITDTFDRKIAALHAHASQHPDPDQLEERMRGWAAHIAEKHGLPEGRLAEEFTIVPTA